MHLYNSFLKFVVELLRLVHDLPLLVLRLIYLVRVTSRLRLLFLIMRAITWPTSSFLFTAIKAPFINLGVANTHAIGQAPNLLRVPLLILLILSLQYGDLVGV